MLLFGILINVGVATMPKTQSNGDYELGYEVGDYFEYYCTEIDTTELNNVFGADWATNLGNYFWFSGYSPPSSEGEKTRFEFVDITNDSTSWYFTMDGWDWTAKTSSYGTPAQDDQIYTLYKNVSSGTFNPTVWIIMLPVLDFISEIQYIPNFYGIGNTIYYNGTDVQDFQVAWVYDETTGIVKNFWINLLRINLNMG